MRNGIALKIQFAGKANMKKRDRTEIIAAILEITSSGYRATNTKIIYQSFISYTMLQEYLSFMMEKGLIEIEENKQRTLSLVSTEKGRSLLYAYNQLNEMIGRKNTDEEDLDNRDQNQ
jgi:predicted transcriptional regulator